MEAAGRSARRDPVPHTRSATGLNPVAPRAAGEVLLRDRFGRRARKLRVSVTDRCNFRCPYCMPRAPVWLPEETILTFEEIERVVRVATGLGVTRVRLTGGEPLVRPRLADLVRALAGIPGLEPPAMTTNGWFLAERATGLAAAGLRSVNVSLDTLRPDRFRDLAGVDGLDRVLAGAAAAAGAGLSVKLNCVVIRGRNEDEVPDLARLGRARGWPVRFIEFMPLDGDGTWSREAVVPEAEILERAAAAGPLVPAPEPAGADPARRWLFADGPGEVGVIASVTRPFCGDCDRIRIAADGTFRTCLFAHRGTGLRDLLRGGAADGEIAAALAGAVEEKGPGHLIGRPGFQRPGPAMNVLGG